MASKEILIGEKLNVLKIKVKLNKFMRCFKQALKMDQRTTVSICVGIMCICCFLLAMNFQNVFGSSSTVELIDILCDDCNLASLFAQSPLALSNGQMGSIGTFC